MFAMLKDSKKCQDFAWLAVRVAVAVVLVLHGYGKLFGGNPGMTGFTAMLTKLGFPLPMVMAYLVAILEFFGGLAIAAGLYTKHVAMALVIEFLVILLYVKKLAFPSADPDLLIFGACVALSMVGAGAYSFDAKLKKS